jgi:hypothetical protein
MVAGKLHRYIRQFLVHSFLYYRLDESLISDQQYDELTRDLRDELLLEFADANFPFKDYIISARGLEGSGYSIRHYPPEIISSALHLLYQDRFKELMSFTTFLARHGYRIETKNRSA